MVTVDNLTTSFTGLSTDEKPTGGRNGDIFIEIDTCTLYAYDEENQQWLKQTSGGSSDGGGDDSGDETQEVVIYDGDAEFELDNETFIGIFAPLTEPSSTDGLKIALNGQTYALVYDAGNGGWVDSLSDPQLGVAYSLIDGFWRIYVLNTELMPSQDSPQTVSVKITQEQSGSSDEYVAEVTFVSTLGKYSVHIGENTYHANEGEPEIVTIPLNNGRYEISGLEFDGLSGEPTLTGALELTDNELIITGDGTFTAPGTEVT